MWRNKRRRYFTQEMEVTFNLLWILWWFRFLLPTVRECVSVCVNVRMRVCVLLRERERRRNKSPDKSDEWQSVLSETRHFIRFIQSLQLFGAAHWRLALRLTPIKAATEGFRLWTWTSSSRTFCLISSINSIYHLSCHFLLLSLATYFGKCLWF